MKPPDRVSCITLAHRADFHSATTTPDSAADTLDETGLAPVVEPDRAIRCRACRHALTTARDKISVESSHEHMQCNPYGITFVFGCFRDAPGCLVAGQAEREHSWFGHYHWQLALCDNCGRHLGWCFTSASAPPFFGLILARLHC